jgi:hypothetical protein
MWMRRMARSGQLSKLDLTEMELKSTWPNVTSYGSSHQCSGMQVDVELYSHVQVSAVRSKNSAYLVYWGNCA